MRILIRILVDLLLVIAAYVFPWWLSVPFAVIAALAFPFFAEFFIVTGIVAVFIHGAFGSVSYVIPIVAILIFLIVEYSKRHLVFYSYQ